MVVGCLHARGWSAARMAVGTLVLVVAVGVVALVLVGLALGPGLLVAAGAFVAWHTWGRNWLARF